MTTNIGFIGAGKVGTAFGNYLKNNGLPLAGYWSRAREHAEEAAAFTDSAVFDSLSELVGQCDLIFVTVTDGAIGEVAENLAAMCGGLEGKTFCHTSGALASDVLAPLKNKGVEIASAHMLLAVSDKSCDFGSAFFTLEGDCEKAAEVLRRCGNEYKIIDPADKPKYHAAAVFASNFVVGLAGIACGLLGDCGFSEREALSALGPLIENNVKNIIEKGPEAALTGPVARGDFGTVKKHLECLKNDALAKEVYETMTKALINLIK